MTRIKLIVGGVLLLLGLTFAVQNSLVVEVKFLVWSMQLSQALVIFLSGGIGAIVGWFLGTAFQIVRKSR